MTTARTPNVKQHEQLPPLASRFGRQRMLPWTTAYPGVEAKTLLVDRSGLFDRAAQDGAQPGCPTTSMC
jgi:hypothetical protein